MPPLVCWRVHTLVWSYCLYSWDRCNCSAHPVYPVFAYHVSFRKPFQFQGCVRRLGHSQWLCVWLVCCLDMSCCILAFQSAFPLSRGLCNVFTTFFWYISTGFERLFVSSISSVGEMSGYLLIFVCWALQHGTSRSCLYYNCHCRLANWAVKLLHLCRLIAFWLTRSKESSSHAQLHFFLNFWNIAS